MVGPLNTFFYLFVILTCNFRQNLAVHYSVHGSVIVNVIYLLIFLDNDFIKSQIIWHIFLSWNINQLYIHYIWLLYMDSCFSPCNYRFKNSISSSNQAPLFWPQCTSRKWGCSRYQGNKRTTVRTESNLYTSEINDASLLTNVHCSF